MSGVRFVSVIVAVVFTLLWGSIVVHSWQKNREARQIAYAERIKAEKLEVKRLEEEADRKAELARKKAEEMKAAALQAEKRKVAELKMEQKLAHADALANAANKEFNKHTDVHSIPLPLRKDAIEPDVLVADKKAEPEKAGEQEVVVAVSDEAEKLLATKVVEAKAPEKSVSDKTEDPVTDKLDVADAHEKSDGKKPLWVIADANSPEYDESKAVSVRHYVWTVPTGNDPIYTNHVGTKIAKIATKIKGEAVEAADVVGDKLVTIADGVKEKIVGKPVWTVPTGATPEYAGRDYETGVVAEWKVPDANEPDYDTSKIVVAKIEDRLSDVIPRGKDDIQKIKKKRTALAKVKKETMTEVVDERIETDNIEEGGVTEVTGNNRSVGEDLLRDFASREDRETAAGNEVVAGGKDTARLSKDMKTVPVRKYAWSVPDGVTPQYDDKVIAEAKPVEKTAPEKVAEKKSIDGVKIAENVTAKKAETKEKALAATTDEPQKKTSEKKTSEKKTEVKLADANKPIWVVPTGNQPFTSVVSQLERGLDKVADVAVEAGSEIADKVVAIGDNVKEAIAAPKKWEIPTGVTPGEDETVVAALEPEVKDADKKPVDTITPAAKLPAKAQDTDAPAKKAEDEEQSAQKADADEEGENEVVYSAKMQDSSEDEQIAVADVDDAASVKDGKIKDVESKVEKTVEKTVGLVSRIIKMIADPADKKTDKADLDNDPYKISRTDKVRFEAIKNLMIDQVDYSFSNVEKGEGKIVISGRSQADAKLSFYVGPRYLGDADADSEGNWDFSRELFIPQGKHIIQAQQMSDSGLSLARKTYPFAQLTAAKAPEGYDGGIGIELGDKALATLRSKLKKEEGLLLANGADKITESEPEISVSTPLPVKKPADLQETKSAVKEKVIKKDIEVAAVTTSIAIPLKKPMADTAPLKDEVKNAALLKAADDEAKNEKAAVKDEAASIADVEKDTAIKDTAIKDAAKKVTDNNDAEKKIAAIDVKPLKQVQTKVADKAEAKIDEKAAKKDDVTLADTPKADAPKYYVVQAGDTLGKIAKETLGDAKKYKLILKLNPKLKSANLIYPKQKLLVRGEADGQAEMADADKKPIKVATIAAPIKKAVVKKEEKAETKKSDTKPETKTMTGSDYVVQQGDSLWKIAKKIYGNGQKFSELIKLNPKLKNNPGAIYPNLKLKVKAG